MYWMTLLFLHDLSKYFLFSGLKLRRQHWCFLGCLLVIVLLLLVIWMASGSSISGSSDLKSMSEAKRAELVKEVLKEVPLIDG